MKIKYFILTIIVLITGSKLAGYNTVGLKAIEEGRAAVSQTNQDVQKPDGDSKSDWQQFKIDAKVKIDANEQKIAKFNADIKADIKTDSKKVKKSYKKEVARLEKQNNELKNKLTEYKYEGKDKWMEFKKGFNHDMDAVGNSINNLFTKKN